MQFRDPDPVESGVPEAPEGVTVPLPPPSAGLPACAVVALSDDALLLEALGGAAGDGASVSSSPSTDRFVDQLVANGGGIALIDATCVPAPLKNFLITVREQFPQLLLLVTGTAQMQAQLAAQIADGTVFRFVHKPASSQRLRLFLDAAVRQQAVQAMPAIHPGPARVPLAPAAAIRQPAPGGGRGVVIGIIAGALLAAVAGWWIWQRRAEAPPSEPAAAEAPAVGAEPAAAPAVAAPQAQEPATAEVQSAHDNPARDTALEQAQRSAQGARADQLAVYLQLVRKRLASGALLEPADDSARSYLDSALALAPDNAEVRATSLAFGEALIAQFRRAVAAGDAVEAQRWLSACNSFHIGSSTLSQLSAQLQQLQSAQQAPAAIPAAVSAVASTTAQAPPTVPTAAAPAAAGAATPSPPPTAAPAAPAAKAAELSAGPAVAPTAAPANPAASAASAPAPVAVAVPGGVPAAAITAAAPVARATTAAPDIVSESSLTRVRFVTPSYPKEALTDNTAGWVELEFTVTAEGKVADVTVTASEPRHVFDSAASYALAHSRYKPVIRDGVPVAQRAHLRERFQP